MTIKESLAKAVWRDDQIKCPTSFQDYNGKQVVNLRTFWRLLNTNGIKTYEEGKHWTEVALSQISEKSLKQKITYFCRYGTLNAPRAFKQLLEVLAKGKNVEVYPKDENYRPNSFDYFYPDILNYKIIIDDEEIEITKEMYNKFLDGDL